MRTDRLDTPDAGDRLADAQPDSRQDMRRRLDGLAHGHPSSPYHPDGSRKPPVTDLRQYQDPKPDNALADRPRPLTDAEHAEHITEVKTRLEKARADGLATDRQHTIDPAREVWSEERDALHDSIIDDLFARSADVPCEHKAILAGGLGGAGKSTVLDEHAGIDRSQYLTINPDNIKEELAIRGMVPQVDGLSPMEASDLVHEESSYIAKRLGRQARAEGKNIIWDITMSSQESTEKRIDELQAAGYTRVEGIFVDIPVETSVTRADARHRQGHDEYLAGEGLGGRFLPPEVIRGQSDPEWGSQNRKTFQAVKSRLDRWSLYDNSVNGGVPVLVDTSQCEEITS